MKIVKTERITRTLTGLVISSAGLFLAANLYFKRSVELLSERKQFRIQDMIVLADDTIPRSDTVTWLENNAFFQHVFKEAPEIANLKKLARLEDRFFHDHWDLIRYLIFMGERRTAYDLISNALKSRLFVNKDDCSADPNCAARVQNVSVYGDQIDRLVSALREHYFLPALDLYRDGSSTDARRLFADLIQLMRLIHFVEDRSLSDYNEMLIVSSFLSNASIFAKEYRLDRNEIDRFSDFIRSSKAGEANYSARFVNDYVLGASDLRNNCFLAAHTKFFTSIAQIQNDSVREIFAFMALRSLARPFVDLTNLELSESDDIIVNDCGRKESWSVYEQRFMSHAVMFRQRYIRHEGLLGSIAIYTDNFPSHVPADGSRLKDRLREFIAQQAASSNEKKLSAGEVNADQSKPSPDATSQAPEPKLTASLPSEGRISSTDGKSQFRWPARGRVIIGYTGRGGNEGINIAIPEGTPIKASEVGTVAYAGNELKGYGNLILIRHPNGYVSAYAHLSELLTKRGDRVDRGQVIGKSGQTGNVSSPQLHFELRRGSTPIDPTPYLDN